MPLGVHLGFLEVRKAGLRQSKQRLFGTRMLVSPTGFAFIGLTFEVVGCLDVHTNIKNWYSGPQSKIPTTPLQKCQSIDHCTGNELILSALGYRRVAKGHLPPKCGFSLTTSHPGSYSWIKRVLLGPSLASFAPLMPSSLQSHVIPAW